MSRLTFLVAMGLVMCCMKAEPQDPSGPPGPSASAVETPPVPKNGLGAPKQPSAMKGPDQRNCEAFDSVGGTSEPGRQDALDVLARCVELSVPELEREPIDGNLAQFVRDARQLEPSVAECDDVRIDQARVSVGTMSLAVLFCVTAGSWDHFEDGSAAADVVYRFTCAGCIERAEAEVRMTMGTPDR